MNTTKSLVRLIVTKAAACAVVAALLGFVSVPAFAQTAEVRYAGVFYKNQPTSVDAMYCDFSEEKIGDKKFIDLLKDHPESESAINRSFTYRGQGGTQNPPTAMDGDTDLGDSVQDPWVASALIEYDQPYPSDKPAKNNYPNHCLALCMNVYCNNRPNGGSTYSITFPLQEIKFDVVKYYNGKNIANADDAVAIRTINLYPNQEEARCASYKCPGGTNSGNTCGQALYWTDDDVVKTASDNTFNCFDLSDTEGKNKTGKCLCQNGKDGNGYVCNYVVYNGDGIKSNQSIPFCAAWDGSYDIAGEFGKTNGNYAFRATVATDAPGDSIVVDKISFNSTIVYPGMNQIPIQVDVTNIHTVRSTPSVVGSITAVAAQPYTYSYRLSKDADVRIAIFDASTLDNTAYATANTTVLNPAPLVRTLVDWQPRVGEGMKGVEKDVNISEFDSWDGRNDDGMLLPAGNYLVSLQAKSMDEWPGVDFSRAVTRQLSLDPLRLTDIQVVGLNKQATAYASIKYTPTESAKVYWNIYTPGTVFENAQISGIYEGTAAILTESQTPTGTAPTIKSGTGALVYSAVENRTGRMNWTSKWDGLCGVASGCTRTYAKGEKQPNGQICALNAGCEETFAYGAPMPDGNYVYVLWAEIPYNGCYYNARATEDRKPSFEPNNECPQQDGTSYNNRAFTGVKTLKYSTGEISVDRGTVDITIQPVSYATVGSSPTAYGLDPFIFKYSIARDANVVAKVENTAGVVVKHLTPMEGITQVSQQMNTISWDGRDDAGRMVAPATYMFVVETKDAMFPAVTSRAAAVFPVDLYRVVDLSTTDVYGDSNARATISYKLSKSMNVQINIYNKDVVIPDYNTLSGVVSASTTATTKANALTAGDVKMMVTLPGTNTNVEITNKNTLTAGSTKTEEQTIGGTKYTITWKVAGANPYTITATVSLGDTGKADVWPPRICDKSTDHAIFTTDGHVDPSKVTAEHACIYVNDTSFTSYPSSKTSYDATNINVRLQPIETVDSSAAKPGDGLTIMEEWDALYFNNPTNCTSPNNKKTDCPYEMVPDGQYPFFVVAKSNEPFSRYYYDANQDSDTDTDYSLTGQPFKKASEVKQQSYWYATEKPVSKINVTRGAVYFLDGSTVVYPNAPQLFNVSSGPIFVPPYEVNFAVSRAAIVEVAIVALQAGVCTPDPEVHADLRDNKAGDVCKYLSTMTIANTSNFDANVIRKIYWDGTDNNGFYVKPGIYEVRLTARNYPNPDLYEATVKSITLNADLLKVFDLLEADGYSIAVRGTDMRIGYQVSVPMKVAIQIFKPGTTIYDYSKGTLRNPTTGAEVTNIRDVLVKSIVGIRPATTLIEELWDGTDYAGQEVPDGTYPFRFVTALNSADIDSVTGEIIPGNDSGNTDNKINYVADTYEYQNLHKATIAIGDGRFVCADWEKTVFFYPNPLKNADRGTLEITKMPVPGEVSIKFFNLAGDLVRDSGYTCVDANNYQTTMGSSLSFNPDNDPVGSTKMTQADLNLFPSQRNAALRCRWDRTNQHGKKVARGVYFGLVDFKAKNGREHCQKVVKVLVP